MSNNEVELGGKEDCWRLLLLLLDDFLYLSRRRTIIYLRAGADECTTSVSDPSTRLAKIVQTVEFKL